MKLICIIPFITSALAIGDDCEWFEAKEGQTVTCLPGWVATGACGSGRRPDCSNGRLSTKHHTMIKCCPHKYQNDPEHDCSTTGYKYGIDAECPKLEPELGESSSILSIHALCTSGRTAACKNDYTQLTCCKTDDITVGPRNQCGWFNGNYGELLECPSGYAIAGYCGSGGNADCDGQKAFAGIMCCPMTDNR